MDRRSFIKVSVAGLVGLSVEGPAALGAPMVGNAVKKPRKGSSYTVIMLGDTHYDTAPDTVYHDGYTDPDPTREANHRKEFKRNSDMWSDRCPRLLKRASCLVDKDTKLILQTGDLIQGDTATKEIHMKMLDDATNTIKAAMGAVPFVTVAGNHDLRGSDDAVATEAYEAYMPARLSKELGINVDGTTFGFWVGEDYFIVADFTHTDDEKVEKLLSESENARYTFFLVHGPAFPYDKKSYKWFYHGYKRDTEQRLHMRKLLARRNAIVLCGHSHTTEFADWYGDGGRITQMTMNSVWKDEKLGRYDVLAEGPEMYGKLGDQNDAERAAYFDEYRQGLKQYSFSNAAGSYRLNVSDDGVSVDFYAGDSSQVSHRFVLR